MFRQYSYLVILILLASPLLIASDHASHWGYEGEAGPKHWGKISHDFSTCSHGKSQSPVDIKTTLESGWAGIDFSYNDTALNLVNNGHTIQQNYDSGSTIKVKGKDFDLLQFHFHSPSENTLNGKAFPLEVHFVHKAKDGQLAVVGVFFDEGPTNKALATLWKHIPKQARDTASVKEEVINANSLLPKHHKVAHFEGSLTTPPCTEGVQWFVMKEPLTLSQAQVNDFVAVVGHNSRPVQSLNGRKVFELSGGL